MKEESCDTLRLKGNAAFGDDDFESAEEFYTKALDIDSRSTAVLGNRSLVRIKLGNFQGAVEDATKCIESDEMYLKGYDRKIAAEIALDQIWKARQTCANGLAKFRKNAGSKHIAYFVRRFKTLCDQGEVRDQKDQVKSLEQWKEVAAYMNSKDGRVRLACLATFWNASSPEERMYIFKQFIRIQQGDALLENPSSMECADKTLKSISLDKLSALPMDNYENVTIHAPWATFYSSQTELVRKVEIFKAVFDVCSDVEKNLIAGDLGNFVQSTE